MKFKRVSVNQVPVGIPDQKLRLLIVGTVFISRFLFDDEAIDREEGN